MQEYEVREKKYSRRFRYYRQTIDKATYYRRVTKLWWRPIKWLGNRYWLSRGLDKVINLFDSWKGKTLKERWNYWGGGGRVSSWVRKYMTYD